ncbi:MAG: hypothetical protein IAF08_17030, partial [Rhizobacter sp.]|nr:hypothetical protein [Chlorobiales bacterium]
VSTKENDFQVLFNRIAITEMTFEQLNRAENSSLTLTGLNAVLTGETRDGASLFATQGDIEIRNLSYENSFGKLADSLRITAKQKSTFAIKTGTFTIDEATATAGEVELTGSGVMDSLYTDSLLFDLKLNAKEADLKKFLSLVPKEFTKDLSGATATGKFMFGMLIKGALTDSLIPGVRITFDLSNASLKYPALPKTVTNIDLRGTVTEKDLDLAAFNATLGGSRMNGSLQVKDFKRQRVSLKLNADVNLGEVKDFYPLERGTNLSGRFRSDVAVNALVSNPSAAIASGKMEFENIAVRTAAMKTPVSALGGEMTFNNQKIDLKNLSMQLGESDIALQGSIENYLKFVFAGTGDSAKATRGKKAIVRKGSPPMLTASLTSRNLDLDKLLPEDSAASKTSGGKVQRKQLPDLTANLSATIGALKVNGLKMTDVSGNMRLKDKVLDLTGLKLGLFDGQITTSGKVFLQDINHPKFDMKLGLTNIRAEKLFTELPKLDQIAYIGKYVKGGLSMQTDLKGTLDDSLSLDLPSFFAKGNFKIADGQISGLPMQEKIASLIGNPNFKDGAFKDFVNAFEVRDGRLFVKGLKMNIAGTEVGAEGSQGFDKSIDYKVNLKLPEGAAAQLDKTLGSFAGNLLKDKSGKIPVALNATGNFFAPKVSIDQSQMGASVKDAVKAKADSVKQVLTDKADAEKNKLEAEGKAKLEAERKRLEEEAKKGFNKLFGR